jgi:hypothetical protein
VDWIKQYQQRLGLAKHPACNQPVADRDRLASRQDSFSGISARKGGLSTTIEVRVPKRVLFMHSRYGQQKATRAYVVLDSPTFLFDNWSALNL